jgi:hypothetical protein
MPPRSTINYDAEPRLYDRIAVWAERDGPSLNATALELLEYALDAYDEVWTDEAEKPAKRTIG